MNVQHLSPILNVRDLMESFAWFEKIGWSRDWDFGDPPDFGSVRNGGCDIFLCKDGQGSRDNWIYVRVGSPAEVDAIHARAQQSGVVVIAPPTDMPWNAREVHVRHPDGHTLRIGAQIEQG